MTSVRNTPAPRPAPTAGSGIRDDVLLDAAREAILAVGWSRATLTDIARRAGVSRMTLYRRWSDTRALFADLMTREWTLTLAGVLEAAPAADDPLRDIVDGVGSGVRALRANPLLARVLELDPELLLPYLFERPGRSQDLLVDVLTARVRSAQEAGAVRAGDPGLLARSVLLAAHGFTLSAHTMGDPARFDAELADLVERYLRPDEDPSRG